MAIFDTHHPGALVFGLLGNFVSFLVFFAPVPTFVRIYKEKSTLGFDSLPYSVALFSCMLWLYYAFLKKNEFLLISINSFGFFIETIYLAIFLYYATKKARTHAIKLLGGINVGLFALIYLITYFALPRHIRAPVVGWICVGFAVTVFAAPLRIVFRVVRTRSVEFMPFGLSFFLTLSAVMWFAYGAFRKDICIAIPNVLGFILGMLQMILYGIYRNSKPVKEDEEKAPAANNKDEEDNNNKINIRVVETPELQNNNCNQHKKRDDEETVNCIPCEISVKPGEVNLQMDSPIVVVRAA